MIFVKFLYFVRVLNCFFFVWVFCFFLFFFFVGLGVCFWVDVGLVCFFLFFILFLNMFFNLLLLIGVCFLLFFFFWLLFLLLFLLLFFLNIFFIVDLDIFCFFEFKFLFCDEKFDLGSCVEICCLWVFLEVLLILLNILVSFVFDGVVWECFIFFLLGLYKLNNLIFL